ncbi:hypothetical protein K227x_19990 [Rubripirellula lacrimiformis]|uniref:Chromo domain-containing protein n=1 Tax=Rubripirellula lacrimiformis TaxID=1930273 RepID=A0A517N8Z9_9BACT|nr:DUF481 domain-containing protein [Rubripirellula lacrimiformis]QDT03615.1 hypothetical protein K227x_19990 [Rubripirellula lacrimiformis]
MKHFPHGRLCVTVCAAMLCWGFGIGLFAMSAALGAGDTPVTTPSWMQGISTFNGTGYDTVPTPSAPSTPSTAATSATPSYTMPVDPNDPLRSNPYFPAVGTANLSGVDGSVHSNPLATPTNPVQHVAGLAAATVDQGASKVEQASETAGAGIDSMVKAVSGATSSLPMPLRSGDGSMSLQDPTGTSVDQILPSASDQIIQQLNAGTTAEVAPLQEEVIRWYQYPASWMKGWDSHAEFGLDGSGGNAETLAIQTGLETKRKTDQYTFSLDVDYRQASSRGVTTEDNGRFNLDYDRLLGDSAWSVFGKYGMEWDKFKAFDLRLNVNGGLGYHWIRTDDASLVTRFGAGASKEIGSPDDAWSPEAVFGIDAERQLTSRQKLKGKIDYFPAWEDFADYRMVADASWEILLDGSDNLSLKLSVTDRYDSTPQGAKPNDIYYSLLLLYKF